MLNKILIKDMEYYFYDPLHGHCLRTMRKVNTNTYLIIGAYGSDEGKKGYWSATAKKIKPQTKNGKTYNFEINFDNKPKIKHQPIYLANWKDRKIHWEDGNTWLQLYA